MGSSLGDGVVTSCSSYGGQKLYLMQFGKFTFFAEDLLALMSNIEHVTKEIMTEKILVII